MPKSAFNTWGSPPGPLLPEEFRTRWREPLPKWVTAELCLPEGATYQALGVSVWKHFQGESVSPRIRAFLVNATRQHLPAMLDVVLLPHPWPASLDPSRVPLSARTRNALRRAGLLEAPSQWSSLTIRDFLRLRSMGLVSILDLGCLGDLVCASAGELAEPSSTQDELLAVIEESWATQVSGRDPRFVDVVPPGSGTVFERIDRVTLEPEDPPIEERRLLSSLPDIRARLDIVSSTSLESALHFFVSRASGLQGMRLAALERRLGTDGKPPATLEETGRLLGVTRERVRQLQMRFDRAVPDHPLFLPQLDRALDAVESAAPCSEEEAKRKLFASGVTSTDFSIESLIELAKLFGRVPTFELKKQRGTSRIRRTDSANSERLIRTTAHRQAGASGASNVAEVVAELRANGVTVTEEAVHSYLSSNNEFEFLHSNWFWFLTAPVERNRLRNVSRKILSVSSHVSIAELREGVLRHFRARSNRGLGTWPLVVPPRAALLAFYRSHPEFVISPQDEVSCVDILDYRRELNPTEIVIVDAIRASGSQVVDRLRLARRCVEQQGMNGNTFSQYLYSSPVISHLGTDLWSLRGVRVDPVVVEVARQANAARPRERKVLDHGWTESGHLWIAVRLGIEVSRMVLGVPSVIRHLIAGQDYEAVDSYGVPSGTIRNRLDGMSYGYGPFLNRRGADEGDILLATFKLAEKRAELRLIDDDELDAISPQ